MEQVACHQYKNLPMVCTFCNTKNDCTQGFIVESNETSNRPYGCSENFIFVGNLCLPSCPNWVLRRKGEDADDIILIIAAVVGLICGILVLLVSAYRHKRM